jgi:phage terminase Nu1 subunit (DNA packaging protein)
MADYITQQELAATLGLSTRQIRNLEAQGLPHEARNNGKFYPKPGAVQWYVAFKMEEATKKAAPKDMEEARLRSAVAEATLVELELAEREGAMIRVDEIDKILAPPLTAVRAKLLNLPSKVAPMVLPCRTLPEIRVVLDAAIAEVMGELQSLGDITDADPPVGAE